MGQEPRVDDTRRAAERAGPEPEEHRIRQRAHEIWVQEGRPDRRALDHWLRARWELERAPDPEAEFERLEHELEPGRKTG